MESVQQPKSKNQDRTFHDANQIIGISHEEIIVSDRNGYNGGIVHKYAKKSETDYN